MTSFYEQKLLRLFERYELPTNLRSLLKSLDEFKTSRRDETALGRMIRLSPHNRATLVNTMVKCAKIMKDSPKEARHCLDIITGCGELLEIADKPPQYLGFPGFLKLPPEIRSRIYEFHLRDCKPFAIIPLRKRGDCPCAPHEPPPYETFRPVKLGLGLTSKQIQQEFLFFFYCSQKFHFSCACEMRLHLANNDLLKSSIRNIMFHWCGPLADSGISQLHKMRQLEKMTVVLSKSTSSRLTPREQEIRRFFGTKRGWHSTLSESLGWDELVALRGLKEVEVCHINKRKADRRTDEERFSLERMLNAYALLAPDEEQPNEDNP